MEIALGVLLGIGLAAACGFRVFIPFLALSVASLAGHVHLAEGFAWVGTWPALAAFAVACVLEVVSYYVPWLDNALDLAATPCSVVAGTLLTAACVTDMSPFLRWSLAAVAGGGVALLVQVATVKARALSSVFTLGAGNAVVSTTEAVGSAAVSALVILLPILTLLVLATTGFLLWRLFRPKPSPGRPPSSIQNE
jgi:hypothetical protein